MIQMKKRTLRMYNSRFNSVPILFFLTRRYVLFSFSILELQTNGEFFFFFWKGQILAKNLTKMNRGTRAIVVVSFPRCLT